MARATEQSGNDGIGLTSLERIALEKWSGAPLNEMLQQPQLLVDRLEKHIQEQVRLHVPGWQWADLANARTKIEEYLEASASTR